MSVATLIPFELPLPPLLPTIEGNVDYRDFRDQLLRIDQLLVRSGQETQLIETDLQQWTAGHAQVSARSQQTRQLHARRALRCNIARLLIQEDFRGFAVRLADSPLLQHFCGLGEVDRVKIPSKSTLQRYDQWWSESQVRAVVQQLLSLGANNPEQLDLPAAVDLETALVDTTCLKANIHYPVDWVLLRDATRSLIQSIGRIRDHGLKHRMPTPQSFLTQINRLCIQMTHTRNPADSQRRRKQTLRQMDRVVEAVRTHARRYRRLLAQSWEQTDWSHAQTQQVLGRMDQILDQLPQARRQARQRILRGQLVANSEKILSLYEPDIHVIVRRKAGAEVEFGNTLLLAENPQGLLLDWQLFQESAPADAKLLPQTVSRLDQAYGRVLRAVVGDRGFDSQSNRTTLGQEGLYNALCPRSPQRLAQYNRSGKFKRLQRRRAQTEGRVGIVKNVFLEVGLRSKGFAHRELSVTWTVLVHNLWVLARWQRRVAAEAVRAAA